MDVDVGADEDRDILYAAGCTTLHSVEILDELDIVDKNEITEQRQAAGYASPCWSGRARCSKCPPPATSEEQMISEVLACRALEVLRGRRKFTTRSRVKERGQMATDSVLI